MKKVSRILILHQGAIGDFILSLPAVGTFRHHYPHATIEMWGYPDILRLVEKRFYADGIASIERKEIAQFYSEDGVLDSQLVEQLSGFDLIVVFGQEGQRTFMDNLKKVKGNTVLWIKTFPPDGKHIHMIDYQLSQLEEMRFAPSEKIPRLFLLDDDLFHASQMLDQIQSRENTPLIALHIGSGSKKKIWPPERFAHLTEKLVQEDGASIILPIGPADEEPVRDYCTLVSSEAITPLRNLPLLTLAAVFKRCRLYVGNDSGITHLAAAVGIPVIALFGPTDPAVWGPRGEKVSIIHRKSECSPCSGEEMKQCVNRKCLEGITVEEVYDRITKRRC
jgi:ADP-heptose:LPS heptosyltransferase